MEFFNKKEEVIDIELTQYGKNLLAKGKFKPKYYAFYDGDIIYDSKYANFEEAQNSTSDRIKSTSRLKTQYAFEGAETRIKKVTQNESTLQLDIDEKALLLEMHQPTQTRIYGLAGQLGTSRLTSHKAPAWRVKLLSGELNDAVSYTTGSLRNELIPQLNVELETVVKIVNAENEVSNLDFSFELSDGADLEAAAEAGIEMPDSFEDGTAFKITHDTVVFEFIEENAEKLIDNFDVEVFEVKEDLFLEDNNEEFHQLYFKKNAKDLMQDLAIHPDKQPVKNKIQNNVEESKYIDHYIDVNLDAQIEATKASSALSTLVNAKPEPDVVPVPGITAIPVNSFACPDEVSIGGGDIVAGTTSTAGVTGGGTGGGTGGVGSDY
jgi:hypothetical protein